MYTPLLYFYRMFGLGCYDNRLSRSVSSNACLKHLDVLLSPLLCISLRLPSVTALLALLLRKIMLIEDDTH